MRLHGEPVVMMRPVGAYDENKDMVVEWVEELVENVLFGQPATAEITETMRDHGVIVTYTLGIPKAYAKSLRGCRVRRLRDGSLFSVVGDPAPLPPELCPTDWNRTAGVKWTDG